MKNYIHPCLHCGSCAIWLSIEKETNRDEIVKKCADRRCILTKNPEDRDIEYKNSIVI